MRAGTFKTVVGDATKPEGLGTVPIIIPHVCNDLGLWGSGFVLAVTKAFGNKAEQSYLDWFDGHGVSLEGCKYSNEFGGFDLGEVQFVKIPDKTLVVANMVGQHNVRGLDPTGRPPIRYGALAKAMKHVYVFATQSCAVLPQIHCPKFGSDLSGGDWKTVEQLILEFWVDNGINVTVYEFLQK